MDDENILFRNFLSEGSVKLAKGAFQAGQDSIETGKRHGEQVSPLTSKIGRHWLKSRERVSSGVPADASPASQSISSQKRNYQGVMTRKSESLLPRYKTTTKIHNPEDTNNIE